MAPEMQQNVPLIEGPITARCRALLLINPHSRRGARSTEMVEARLPRRWVGVPARNRHDRFGGFDPASCEGCHVHNE